jgi:antitoxin (DNA-binding transcriptional repressor) of toxin-antitoxin stability system
VTVIVNIGEAKTRLSELIARVEAGEEIIIARGHEPIARLDLERRARVWQATEDIRALRARAKPVTVEEILAWKREGCPE